MQPITQYESFSDLAASEQEGRDYSRELVDRGSDIVVVAPHGGGIEQGTSEIARAVAGEELSLYCFNGMKRTANRRLHITSTRFDEPEGLELVRRSRVVVAIHGLQGEDEVIYVGGLDEGLKTRLGEALGRAGFETRESRGRHAGISPLNTCNRASTGQGVQLELTRGLRRAMFQGLDRRGRRTKRPTFHRFVGVIRAVLLDADGGGRPTSARGRTSSPPGSSSMGRRGASRQIMRRSSRPTGARPGRAIEYGHRALLDPVS